MSKTIWTEEETLLLKNSYSECERIEDLLLFIPNKTCEQIRSKAKSLKLRKSKRASKPETIDKSKPIQCLTCKESHYLNENLFVTTINKKTGIVSVNRTCKKCKNKKGTIVYYKKSYGIVINFNKMYNTYTPIQWYEWTFNKETPNGKKLPFIPSEVQNKENIAIISRYVIENLMGYRTKDEILSLSQKDMEKYKISFSKTDFILNSPINLIRLAFPELEFYNWEMTHSGNNFWKEYSNFLEAVKYYYQELYLKFYSDTPIEIAFHSNFMEDKFSKLHRAYERYYTDKTWSEILQDIGVNVEFPINNKIAADGVRLDSFEERLVYEYIKFNLGIDSIKKSKLNNKEFKFYDEVNDSNYYPDFILNTKNKTYIVEYFGGINTKSDKEVFKGYRTRTLNKVDYFSNLKDYEFIDLYDVDLSNNFNGIYEKMKHLI